MQDDASHAGTVSGTAVLSPLCSFAPDCATFVTCEKNITEANIGLLLAHRCELYCCRARYSKEIRAF